MVIMKTRLACCTWDKGLSVDFDKQDRIVTYNGLESYILDSNSRENESSSSTGDKCVTDSQDEDDSSCSSSNNACSSFASNWTTMKKDEHGPDEWDFSESPQYFYEKEKPSYKVQFSDVETMREKFAKLLLGEDVTGGCKGVSPAVAISNAITNLSGTVFGELWKLEPLSEERKSKWRREMDWLLSPTNYMIELVPAKQHGANGRTLEIMTPKVRSDIHMILPALQKLDSMLIETLDSMKNTEFWYAEGGSRAEGRERVARQSKRWWLPLPRVPMSGLSNIERKKLLDKGKFVHQVLKAAKAINENVLLEMPVPTSIREALPKSGKASLGDDLYRKLNTESNSAAEMLDSLNLKSDHKALETINRLEAAALAWKERISAQVSTKSPARTSWSFKKDPISELDKTEFLLNRAEALIKQIKSRYPNLPQTFLDATKIQYGQDVGHSILEAYSRALSNLAFSILSRIGDILQEDIISNPSSPMPTCSFPGINLTAVTDMASPSQRVRHSLIDQMNGVDNNKSRDSNAELPADSELPSDEPRSTSVSATPICNRVLCIGGEACSSASSTNSP